MSSTGPIVGNFQIAQAYKAQRAANSAAPTKAHSFQQQQAAAKPAAASRLVGGSVPGRVNFSTAEPSHDAAAIPFYRHPADKNAAATSVTAGRLIDVNA